MLQFISFLLITPSCYYNKIYCWYCIHRAQFSKTLQSEYLAFDYVKYPIYSNIFRATCVQHTYTHLLYECKMPFYILWVLQFEN